jgi:hypothetical protein
MLKGVGASNADTGEVCGPLRCLKFANFLRDGGDLESAVVLGYPNSERTQQNGADKSKHGTHRQNIEPQGKVHVTLLLFEGD